MIRRAILLVGLIVAFSVACAAQTTTVTGTIKDANGNLYANGTASAIQTVASGQNPGTPTNVTTNASAFFTMSLSSPASYLFTICAMPVNIGPLANPTPTQVCFSSAPISVSGGTLDVSTLLNPLAKLLGPVTPINGVAGNPAPPVNCLQYNNAGVFGGAAGICTPDGNSLTIGGPDPWVDISALPGGRYSNGGTPNGTLSCTSGSPNVVAVSSFGWLAATFPGDGFTAYGCGPNAQAATPTGLTVTRAGFWGPTKTQSPVGSPPAVGSSTYSYTVFAIDFNGGLSIPATPVTITNGFASLGLQTVTINTLSRTNDRVTVTLTSAPAQPLVLDELVEIIPTTGSQFYGWFNIAQIDSSTQFEVWTTVTDTRAQGWINGDITSATGGTVYFYRGNFLAWTPSANAWKYGVCGKRPGDTNYHLIGLTNPTGLDGIAYIDASFEDEGSPYEDLKNYPVYIQTVAEATFNNNATNIAAQTTSNARCTAVSALNDEMTGTIISSPDGGTTLVTTVNASQTVNAPGAVWYYDNAPAITAALARATSNNNKSAIYIPPVGVFGYRVNSPIVVPTQVTIIQSGRLSTNESFVIQGSTNWVCNWGNAGAGGSATNQGAPLNAINASPAIYAHGQGNSSTGCNFASSAANGGVAFINDSASATFENVSFYSSGVNVTDYTGMAFIQRGVGSAAQAFFHNVGFQGGPNQITEKSRTPLVWEAPGQNGLAVAIEMMFDNITNIYRGFVFGGGGVTGLFGATGTCAANGQHFRFKYRQAGIMPVVTTMGCPSASLFTYEDVLEDTEGQPLQVNLSKFPQNDSPGPKIEALNVSGGVGNPLVTGNRGAINIKSNFANATAFPNRDASYDSGGLLNLVISPYQTPGTFSDYRTAVTPLYTLMKPTHMAGGYQWWFDTVPPSGVTAAASAGGSVPAGTYVYAISMAGYNNGETILSIPSSSVTTSGGTQTVTVNWTNPLGSYSSNVWRCPTTNTCTNPDGSIGLGPWFRVALHVTGASYVDTIASPVTFNIPTASGTGSTVVDNTGVSTPVLQVPTILVGSLPGAAAGNAGQYRTVKDSTAIAAEGQTCVGGGAVTALAFSTGAAWKCF